MDYSTKETSGYQTIDTGHGRWFRKYFSHKVHQRGNVEFKGTLVVTDMKLSEVAERALTFIKKDNVTYPELVNLYRNTAKSKTINEIEREILTQALETVMRTSFPQQASNVLGRKDDKPVEVLEEVYNTVQTKFDLSGNLHKNGVKVSGDMIGGRSYIGWYISYKNRQGWGNQHRISTKEI